MAVEEARVLTTFLMVIVLVMVHFRIITSFLLYSVRILYFSPGES